MMQITENILVAYYSHSGNTRQIAEFIHQAAGGTLHEILPETPYPRAYNAVLNQSEQEIKQGYKPPLQSSLDSIESYTTIFIGTPNWWSTIAPPVAAFLSQYDFSGITILPFCTHGGGRLGKIEEDIKKLCPRAAIPSRLAIRGSGGMNAQTEVAAWLDELGLSA